MRNQGSEHLSREGVALARRVGERLDDYDLVVSSEMPRAIETAIAMGYGVDRYVTMLASVLLADEEVDTLAGCGVIAVAAQRWERTARATAVHADVMRSIATALPEDGRALIVSHGGIIELGVVGLLPDLDFRSWGPSCERCEAVRMYFEADRCTGAELLRIADLLGTA